MSICGIVVRLVVCALVSMAAASAQATQISSIVCSLHELLSGSDGTIPSCSVSKGYVFESPTFYASAACTQSCSGWGVAAPPARYNIGTSRGQPCSSPVVITWNGGIAQSNDPYVYINSQGVSSISQGHVITSKSCGGIPYNDTQGGGGC